MSSALFMIFAKNISNKQGDSIHPCLTPTAMRQNCTFWVFFGANETIILKNHNHNCSKNANISFGEAVTRRGKLWWKFHLVQGQKVALSHLTYFSSWTYFYVVPIRLQIMLWCSYWVCSFKNLCVVSSCWKFPWLASSELIYKKYKISKIVRYFVLILPLRSSENYSLWEGGISLIKKFVRLWQTFFFQEKSAISP